MPASKKPLTDKQDRFCHEYIIEQNGTQAAIRAGYSNRTAGAIANEILKKPEIRARVDELLDEIKAARIATATEVQELLTRIMRREEQENMVVPKTVMVSEPGKDGKIVKKSITTNEVVKVPARLSDVNKAAELMGKRHALFTDKVQVEQAPIVITGGDELDE